MNEVELDCSSKGMGAVEATCHHRWETLVAVDTDRSQAHLALMMNTVSL